MGTGSSSSCTGSCGRRVSRRSPPARTTTSPCRRSGSRRTPTRSAGRTSDTPTSTASRSRPSTGCARRASSPRTSASRSSTPPRSHRSPPSSSRRTTSASARRTNGRSWPTSNASWPPCRTTTSPCSGTSPWRSGCWRAGSPSSRSPRGWPAASTGYLATSRSGSTSCYGDYEHHHFAEPASLQVQVDLANAVSATAARPVDWYSFTVPQYQRDPAYFAPLQGLRPDTGTEIYFALVPYHPDKQEAGTTAEQVGLIDRILGTRSWGICTECGMGRAQPHEVPLLLDAHREILAGAARG